jgi:hypothetical protein
MKYYDKVEVLKTDENNSITAATVDYVNRTAQTAGGIQINKVVIETSTSICVTLNSAPTDIPDFLVYDIVNNICPLHNVIFPFR